MKNKLFIPFCIFFILKISSTANSQNALDYAYSPDGKFVMALMYSSPVGLFELSTGFQFREYRVIANYIAYCNSGKYIAFDSYPSNSIYIYNVEKDSMVKEIKLNNKTDYLKFTPNSKYIAFTGRNPKLLNFETGEELSFDVKEAISGLIDFSPDNKLMAVGTEYSRRSKCWFTIFDVETKTILKTIKVAPFPLMVNFSEDGKFLTISLVSRDRFTYSIPEFKQVKSDLKYNLGKVWNSYYNNNGYEFPDKMGEEHGYNRFVPLKRRQLYFDKDANVSTISNYAICLTEFRKIVGWNSDIGWIISTPTGRYDKSPNAEQYVILSKKSEVFQLNLKDSVKNLLTQVYDSQKLSKFLNLIKIKDYKTFVEKTNSDNSLFSNEIKEEQIKLAADLKKINDDKERDRIYFENIEKEKQREKEKVFGSNNTAIIEVGSIDRNRQRSDYTLQVEVSYSSTPVKVLGTTMNVNTTQSVYMVAYKVDYYKPPQWKILDQKSIAHKLDQRYWFDKKTPVYETTFPSGVSVWFELSGYGE